MTTDGPTSVREDHSKPEGVARCAVACVHPRVVPTGVSIAAEHLVRENTRHNPRARLIPGNNVGNNNADLSHRSPPPIWTVYVSSERQR